jgi:hypothetical protein
MVGSRLIFGGLRLLEIAQDLLFATQREEWVEMKDQIDTTNLWGILLAMIKTVKNASMIEDCGVPLVIVTNSDKVLHAHSLLRLATALS